MFMVLAAIGTAGFVLYRAPSTVAGGGIGQLPTPSQPGRAEDEQAIRANATAYVKAFNASDARALAALWAPEGEYIDAGGRTFRGRAAIEKEMASFFVDHKSMKVELISDSLRFVGPGVALESGHARVTRTADGAVSLAGYNVVHVQGDGKWFLASVRETHPQVASNYEHLKDLEWLIGTWTAKGQSRSIEQTCEWAHGRNVILRKYTIQGRDGSTQTGTQIIAWDPQAGAIRSWSFDSEGALGSDQWSKESGRWVLEAKGVMRDGSQTEATNLLTPIDRDSYTWQSIGRSSDGMHLPDTTPVKVTRVKPKK
jgi:uncharacterized protein (TIGR02246 family)